MIIMRRRQKTEQKKGILHMDTPTDSRGIYCRRNKLKEKTKQNCHRHWLRNILSFTRSIVESTVTAETAVV